MLFVNNLAQNGNEAQLQKYLPDVCSGACIGGMGMSEPGVGTDVLSMKTTAAKSADGSHYVLNGIAYDNTTDTLLVTGKQWDHIYQIRLVPHPVPHTDVREACFGTWDSFADVDARAGSGAGESGPRRAVTAATTAAARADLSLADPAWAATGSRRATARRTAVDRTLLGSQSEE